jgi:hypothetical protein
MLFHSNSNKLTVLKNIKGNSSPAETVLHIYECSHTLSFKVWERRLIQKAEEEK